MKIGVRIFLVLLFGALVLAVSPAALGDEATFQLVTPNGSSNCSGFTVETVDGTISGCTRLPDGITMIHTEYSAAADGSIVFMADDGTGGTGTI